MSRIVTLKLRKALEEQAAERFEAAKKAKKKLAGVEETIARFEKEVPKTQQKLTRTEKREKAWYEKFRWATTASGGLLIGGKDAGTNEVLLKKHLEPTDLVFHTDAPGSPFVLLRGDSTDEAKALAAAVTACYSKAWKRGVSTADVFFVNSDQVSKTAQSGEYISKGSFMVRGERTYLQPTLSITLGVRDAIPQIGLQTEFVEHEDGYAILAPGDEKGSDTAKQLSKRLGGTPDEWTPLIPSGGAKIVRIVRARAKPQDIKGDEGTFTI